MHNLDWNDYFDNDRESGDEAAPDVSAPERLNDAIIRLANNGLTAAQIAEDLDTGEAYVLLVISWSK